MRYPVTWSASAEKELTLIWTLAADKQAVADAADEIDRLLGNSATAEGEDLGNCSRLVVAPLEVFYTISPDDCMVRVYQVRRVS